jgi:hypothetical protein
MLVYFPVYLGKARKVEAVPMSRLSATGASSQVGAAAALAAGVPGLHPQSSMHGLHPALACTARCWRQQGGPGMLSVAQSCEAVGNTMLCVSTDITSLPRLICASGSVMQLTGNVAQRVLPGQRALYSALLSRNMQLSVHEHVEACGGSNTHQQRPIPLAVQPASSLQLVAPGCFFFIAFTVQIDSMHFHALIGPSELTKPQACLHFSGIPPPDCGRQVLEGGLMSVNLAGTCKAVYLQSQGTH